VDEQTDQARSDLRIAVLAARQHGVVSWRQLTGAGLRRGAIDHRVRIGWLHRMYRGVFAVGHRPLTRDARWMDAVLAAANWPRSATYVRPRFRRSGPTAGRGFDVTVPIRTGRESRDRIRLHRSSTLKADDVTTHRGIPVTTIARTLLDIVATFTAPALARTVEQTEIRRLFDLKAIEGTLARHPKHPGRARLTRAIDLYRDDELTRSDLEAVFLALCQDHAIPRPLVNHIIENDEVDFFWPHQRLVVETDGRGTHLTRAAFERDRDRDARLVALGYRVLRFTERQVTADTEIVAARLSALLPTSASR